MRKIKHILIWVAISLLAGAVGSHFFNVEFWLSSLIAGVALIINGLIAEWEDRDRE
jgi:uncharacterized protein YqfA (UPF0365 family)